MNKAAQSLARLARGVPKNFSADELELRRKRMAVINNRKRMASKTKKRRRGVWLSHPNDKAEARRDTH